MMMMMMRFMLRLLTFDHPLHSSRDGEIWCEMVDGLTVFFYDNISDNIRVVLFVCKLIRERTSYKNQWVNRCWIL